MLWLLTQRHASAIEQAGSCGLGAVGCCRVHPSTAHGQPRQGLTSLGVPVARREQVCPLTPWSIPAGEEFVVATTVLWAVPARSGAVPKFHTSPAVPSQDPHPGSRLEFPRLNSEPWLCAGVPEGSSRGTIPVHAWSHWPWSRAVPHCGIPHLSPPSLAASTWHLPTAALATAFKQLL